MSLNDYYKFHIAEKASENNESKWFVGVPYLCKTTNIKYVILRSGKFMHSFLPVEIITGEEINDEFFDAGKHKSHLLNCPKHRDAWNKIKDELKLADAERTKREMKEFCR